MVEIIGLIPAREGSKGIPGKNIRDLAGKPLIAWTIETALNSKACSRLIVSTDSQDIKTIAQDWGAEVPFIRPDHLANDTATSISVVNHAIEFLRNDGTKESDYILLLQPTSPLRKEEDIQKVIDIGQLKDAVAVISVTEPSYHPCKTHMITPKGVLQRFFKNNSDNERRQDLPLAYAENGAVYLNRISSLTKEQTFIPKNKTYPYIMPPERSIDVDTLWDLYLAELILKDQTVMHK
jgi:CMP-N,N'-diacetyllegionaminic acid synthase